MKFYLTLSLFISFYNYGQIDSLKVNSNDSTNYTRTDILISHFSGTFGKLRSTGHIVTDSSRNIVSKSMHCKSFEDSTIFYYQLTKYYSNGLVSYDSIVDFRKRHKAKSLIQEFNENGNLVRTRKIQAKLDPKRIDIPIRSETKWNGKEIYYDKKRRKLTKEKINSKIY